MLEYWNGLIKKHGKWASVTLSSPLAVPLSRSELTRRSLDRAGLAQNFRYNSEYVGSTWSESDQSHTLTLKRPNGETFSHTADVLISANGPLSSPTIPNLPGLDKFKGQAFHNLRWRTDVDFTNKRVAVVGNGSSAIQLIVSSV